MKMKIVSIIGAAVIVLTTLKAGYVFYEYQMEKFENEKTKIETTTKVEVNEYASNSIRGKITVLAAQTEPINEVSNSEDTQLENSFEDAENFDCCQSGSVNMYDENGYLKDKEQFKQELEQALEEGSITEEDNEFFLYMYEQCQPFLQGGISDWETETGGYLSDYDDLYQEGDYPSCH